MEIKQQLINDYLVQHLSERFLSIKYGISRTTVRKYLQSVKEAFFHTDDISVTSDALHTFCDTLQDAPKCKFSERTKRSLTPAVVDEINRYLALNAERVSSNMRKQQLKARDMHDLLVDKGFHVSYESVCRYLRKNRPTQVETFVRQSYIPGDVCEFDWGELKLFINGKKCKFYIAVFTMAYSNYRYALLFRRQDTIAFMESHIDFFKQIGYSPKTMVYDNMKVAVARFIENNEKQPTVALLQLSSYYSFQHRFCNIRKGNEKGHVERSVEYVRRKAFAEKVDFSSLDEANAHLLSVLDRLNTRVRKDISSQVLLQEEYPFMKKQLYPMEMAVMKTLKVDKWSTIYYNGNHYSVPEKYTGKYLDVKIYSQKLEVVLPDQENYFHSLCSGQGEWVMDLNHYLHTFCCKPGAMLGSVAFMQAQEAMRKIYEAYFIESPVKDFIRVLHYCSENSIDIDELRDVCCQLNKLTTRAYSADAIITMLIGRRSPKTEEGTVSFQDPMYIAVNNQLFEISNLMPQ